MRILLVHSNFAHPPVSPIGLEYIASSLLSAGFDVKIFDVCLHKNWNKVLPEIINHYKPDVIGVSLRNVDDCSWPYTCSYVNLAKKLVDVIKENTEAPVVLGGAGYSIFPEALLKYTCTDYGLLGDGDLAFVEFIKNLSAGAPEKTPGLIHRRGRRVHRCAGEPIRGFQRRMFFFSPSTYYAKGGQGSVEFSRGCCHSCTFCVDPLIKGRLRVKDPEETVEEIKLLSRRWIHHIYFTDSEINLDIDALHRLMEEIIKHGLHKKVKWYAYMTVDEIDRTTALLMKYSGCAGVNVTLSTGCEKLLPNYGHYFSLSQAAKLARTLKEAEIPFMFDIFSGGPDESRETLKETADFFRLTRPPFVGVSLGIRAYPGTPLGERAKEKIKCGITEGLHGRLKNNEDLLFPVYYLSEKMSEMDYENFLGQISSYTQKVFAPSFRSPSPHAYTTNKELQELIRKGHKGAYWLIVAGAR